MRCLPEAPKTLLAACLILFAGKNGIRAEGAIFCRPEYPATRKLTRPLTTLGFLPEVDATLLLPDLLLRLLDDGIEDEISCARSLVSNLSNGLR